VLDLDAGQLNDIPTVVDPRFGIVVPVECPDVPSGLLQPRSTWQDRGAYDQAAAKLARMFATNFEAYADNVTSGIRAAGPRVDD
jgi:phosphoenolpyruvate carboxykinase (ATP)